MPAKGVAPRRSSREGGLAASQSGGDFEGETSNEMNRGHNLRCARTGQFDSISSNRPTAATHQKARESGVIDHLNFCKASLFAC